MKRMINETFTTGNGSVQIKTFMHEFTYEGEREEYLDMLRLGSKFNMRYRALVCFYGRDLIAYKRKHLTSPQVNEFLRIFSAYLTTNLEDDCPDSWSACTPEFWEEFIIEYIPRHITITKKQMEMKNLLIQLKRFICWLDQQGSCSWFAFVEKYVENVIGEMMTCERALNDLFAYTYPNYNQADWSPIEDLNNIMANLEQCDTTVNSIFEVRKMSESIVSLYDIDTTRTYELIHFPLKKITPGILLDCVIGKKYDDIFWTLYFTDTVYPNKAQKYICFVG
ncbi:hypothetical protein NC661_18265 [Aquibacillus koreensis]|uniref:Uncharacterized protein n=1 Tax=Aquibacillus koreensis TaxID=279446 RepID=A0A9X3WS17_9BACI|nr:hypothetical protein [Aquibacillus koreensis]MCT2535464.1 hypothetical protein [Aquibacillus koreensis]MDC3422299.1 hypothetical protein [Aquibacillus koreensis]